MRTLVTGATGFVGINIVEALLARGDDVVAFGHGPLPPQAQAALAGAGARLTVVEGDVRDAACVESLFAGRRIDRLVHGSAVTAGVDREKRDAATIVEVNVTGTVRVLEAAHRHGVGRIVHVSSGSAYGRSLFEHARLFEGQTPERPESFYQVTKFAGERAALRLKRLLGLGLHCVRLGSVIGPWERDTGVRDTLSTHFQLAGMAQRGEAAVLPQREFRRDWVYSRDVAAGVVALLDARSPSHDCYNLSAGRAWGSLARWCEALRAAYPRFSFRVAAAGEESNLGVAEREDRGVMDVGRMRQDIGFSAAFGPDEAYPDYIDWLRRTQ